MLYLLDASSIITAQDGQYSIRDAPEFWSWLLFQAECAKCKIPKEVFDEISPSDPQHKEWLSANKTTLQLASEARFEYVQYVLEVGYGTNMSEIELTKIGGDPYLIASAYEDKRKHCVVTEEVSRP